MKYSLIISNFLEDISAAAAKLLQSCPTLRPHRRQPTRLPRPWDSPGKNTGVGCHFLLQCMKVKSESEVSQSCPTLSDPMNCSPPGSSIHGIFQARVLERGAIAAGSPVPSTPERREGLRACYWEGPSELPERRSSSCAPRPLLIATGEAIPLRGLEGVPGLRSAPQDEAGLTRKFETSHVGPQLSLATRGEDWASQGQPKGKAEIPVVTRP